ncbi:MAG: prolyl oligopeptidase family serine peptidase, partial [Anaerolineae bacterium]|nr:prolyl oligopeptidase family serine peptidase [Anaerolineae bacterium]
MDVYRVDVDGGDFYPLVENQNGTGSLTGMNSNTTHAIAQRILYRGNSDLLLIDLFTGEEVMLTPHEGPGSYLSGRFSQDAKDIFLASDHLRDRIALCRIVRDDDGKPGPIEVLAARDDADLQEFCLSPDGLSAALVWNCRGGRSELEYIALDGLALRDGPILPAEVVRDLSYAADGRSLVFTAEGSTMPQNVWLLDVASGETRQLTFSQHPGIDLNSLVPAELVQLTAYDELELTGWLYRPREFTLPGAVVLSFHGGPEGQEIPAFNPIYQALAARGVAVFAPNVRGSGGFGKRFVNLDNGSLRQDAIKDVRACVDYLIASGLADPKRIGIMGGSYGGYMTMAGLTSYPDLFAAGVNIYGVVNFRTFFAHTEPWMAAISKVEYGDPATELGMLDSLSPITLIDQVQAPTLVLHGLNDTNVPVLEAEQVVAGLERRGIPVNYILFTDEGHGFLKEPNRVRAATAIVNWFGLYLLEPSQLQSRSLPVIPAEALPMAETIVGLTFTPAERDLMLENLRERIEDYQQIRAIPIPNGVPPALSFDPRLPGMSFSSERHSSAMTDQQFVSAPDDLESVAFWPITRLAALIRSRQVTSEALTEMYLRRLKRFDPVLHCVVTLAESLALEQARRADREIASGHYRGVLHGVPYGLKDLLSTRGIRTTWGAEPFVDQVFDYDATVVERLEAAGAVLVAKLAVGALAWGDVWFGGMTRNPWKLDEGSSGSSAGSASATAAGLVGFAIGTETYGSIVSPSTRCRVSGLRPTFGRVSRHGAMALSWSMDKIGPICRAVEDCVHVFEAIYGPDGKDLTVVDMPFDWVPDLALSDLRIGYLKSAFNEAGKFHALHQEALHTLTSLGARLIPIDLSPYPVEALNFILSAEAAAAFDDLTRSNRDDMLVRQVKDAWPNVFRQARFIPAV